MSEALLTIEGITQAPPRYLEGDHMASPIHMESPGVGVVEMDQDEWQAAVKKALSRLGLTYEQLARQAYRRDFSSLDAQKLWVIIGGGNA